MIPDRLRAVAVSLLARVEHDHDEMRRREAIGWTVVCIDEESDRRDVAHCSGFLATQEDALFHAAALDDEDRRLGTTGWRHAIAPIFPEAKT